MNIKPPYQTPLPGPGIYSNAVPEKMALIVTLIDSVDFLEVHWACNLKMLKFQAQHFLSIKETIESSLRVIKIRKYSIETPKYGFYCNYCTSIEHHFAIVEGDMVMCTENPVVSYPATNQEKRWMSNNKGIDKGNVPELSHRKVYEAFLPIVNNWRLIGLALEIDYTTRDNIWRQKPDARDCLDALLHHWKINPSKEHPYNWDTVYKVLLSDTLDAKGVASKLQRRLGKE